MLVKLTEVCTNGAITVGQDYRLREVFVNPEHVIMIREDVRVKQLNENGLLSVNDSENLDKEHRFSKLTINRGHTGSEIVVVGSPDVVENILKRDSKQILRG
mgnify:CR=1 FL=1